MSDDLERTLRDALGGRAGSVEPLGGDSLGSIRSRTVVARRRRQRLQVGGAALAVVALIGISIPLLGGDHDADSNVVTGPSDTTTSLAPGDGTTVPPVPGETTTTGAGHVSLSVPDGAIWPYQPGNLVDPDPTANPSDAARRFAVEVAGMKGPSAGAAYTGSGGATVVPVTPNKDDGTPLASGIRTDVSLIRVGADGPWVVTGAATSSVLPAAPAANAAIGSPVNVSGKGRGFEGNIVARVIEVTGSTVSILGFQPMIGGSMGTLENYSGQVMFSAPHRKIGAMLYLTDTGLDIGSDEFALVPVRFGGIPAPITTTTRPGPGCQAPTVPSGDPATTMLVTVVYHCGEGAVPLQRRVAKNSAVLRTSLEQLLAGPTADEAAGGFTSFFSPATASLLNGVTIHPDGSAIVDFGDLAPVIPNASSSAGSAALLAELDGTLGSITGITSAEYRINGSCEAFWNFLQGTCHPEPIGP